MTKNTHDNISNMVDDLKNADTKYANIVKGVQMLYWIIIPIYVILIGIHIFNKAPIPEILGSCCMLLGMVMFAFLMRHYYKTYSKVDYSLPTLLMLKQAAYRYKPFQRQAIWALLAIIMVDLGLSFMNHAESDFWHTQMWFIPLIIVSIIGGLIWWYVRYKPIRDGALKLIKEIEEEVE
jgi:hypothetical protein